jgi:small GTP-binding protein
MGNVFGSYYEQLMSLFEKKANILMLGLDSAGKTTILYKLKLDTLVTTIPTIGFNVENVKFKSLNMTVWDVGGQEKIRPLWRHYYQNIDAVIFVIDSNDGGRLDEVSKELHSLMAEDELREATVLILCNKQDLPHALSVHTINEKLELMRIKQKWYVQPTSALYNEGIFEGLDWLYNNIEGK